MMIVIANKKSDPIAMIASVLWGGIEPPIRHGGHSTGFSVLCST